MTDTHGLRARWRRLVCRLRGHDIRALERWGGWPNSDVFGIDAECRRCGADCSIAMPSRMTIYREDPER